MRVIVKVLCDNDFKKSDITKVKKKMNRPRNDQQSDDAADDEQKFISLPYIKGTSETLKCMFATHKIKCSFYFKETLRKHLSKPKDLVELDKKSNVVYKIPCKDCNVSYIGETKRSFKVRTNEHKRAVKNQDVDKNEIADHCWKNDHEMNWEERKVIDAEPYIYARKIKETIHSIKDKNHINSISYNLPEIWIPNLNLN